MSFLAGVGLTIFSLVVLPGQWIPVLFRDDLTVIALSLVLLGIGTLVAAASLAQRTSQSRRAPLAAASVAVALCFLATLLYKTVFGGIGWPEPQEVALGIGFVVACAPAGTVVGRVSRNWLPPASFLLTATAFIFMGAGGVWLFSSALPESLEPRYEASSQSCETRKLIQYCANPGYEPFIDKWEPVVDRILDVAPIDVARSEIVIAQLLDNDGKRVARAAASPGLDWGKGAGLPVARLAFGLDVANWVTGLETRFVRIDRGEPLAPCGPGTNARAVIAYWLAGQLGDDVVDVIADLGCCADAINGSTFATPAVGGGWDVATQLLDLPTARVRPLIDERWDELVDPDTSVSRVSEIFDLGSATRSTEEVRDKDIPLCDSRFERTDPALDHPQTITDVLAPPRRAPAPRAAGAARGRHLRERVALLRRRGCRWPLMPV